MRAAFVHLAIAFAALVAGPLSADAAICPSRATRDQGFSIHFGPAYVIRVLRHQGDDIIYQSVQGEAKPIEVIARHGIFVKQSTGSFGVNQFDYRELVDAQPAPSVGGRVVVSGAISRSTGAPQTFEWTIEGGSNEAVTIGGCALRGVNITRMNVIDGRTSRISMLYISELMISVRTKIEALGPTGAVEKTFDYLATEITPLVP